MREERRNERDRKRVRDREERERERKKEIVNEGNKSDGQKKISTM